MKLDDHPQFKKDLEAYTVSNADKKVHTKAYQKLQEGMKGKDGQPLYKADHMKEVDHMKEEQVDEV